MSGVYRINIYQGIFGYVFTTFLCLLKQVSDPCFGDKLSQRFDLFKIMSLLEHYQNQTCSLPFMLGLQKHGETRPNTTVIRLLFPFETRSISRTR